MVRAGQRRTLVLLETPGTAVADGDGGFAQTFTVLSPARMWSEIKPATAQDLERIAAGTVLSTATHIVTMRFHAGVTTKARASWTDKGGAHAANVTGVFNPGGRCIDTVLVCAEVVA